MSRKERSNRHRGERGDAFVATVLLVIVMAALASAMMVIALEDRERNRSSSDLMQVQYVAEAGAQRAIVDLDTGGDGIIGSEASPIAFSGGNYWTAAVDGGDGSYTLVCRAVLGREKVAIEVVVSSERTGLFTKGMFGDLDVDLTGNVFADSYDSRLGTYASQATNTHGPTGATYANANGTVGSNASISVGGNSTVLGDVTPGPGNTVSITGGSVYIDGSTAPADDASELPPVAYAPSVGSSGPLHMSGGNLDLTDGTFRYDDLKLSGKATVTIRGKVTLYLDGDVSVSGKGSVVIEPGGSLTVVHGTGDFSLTGNGLWNKSEIPSDFVLKSATTGTVKFAGNSGFYGAVYAPGADLQPTGTTGIYGSVVGRTVTFTGTADFHYDEALAEDEALSRPGTVEIASWRRIGF